MVVNSNRFKRGFWVAAAIVILGLVVFVASRILLSSSNINSSAGRVNILVMGRSGAGNDSPDLTDTMIFASVSLDKPRVALISIPRDIWIAQIRAKINSAYYWGGIPLVKSLVEKITGQPVHYAVVVDFSGFKDIIDAVGGVDVGVERSFTDTKYPIAGKENDLCDGDPEFKCRFETLHFVQGEQKMDGETALKFVRSRNGDNNENTDLAREARQQKVISALKNEVLSTHNLINPATDLKIYKVLKSAVETDMGRKVVVALGWKLFLARNNIKSYIFPLDLLVNPPISKTYDMQYVFVPKADDWSRVWDWVKISLSK